MFSRTNNSQPKDTKVQEEIITEDKLIQSMGNEATQSMPPILPNIGNQAVNNQIKDLFTEKIPEGPGIIDDDSSFGGMRENDFSRGRAGKFKPGQNISNIIDNISNDDGRENASDDESVISGFRSGKIVRGDLKSDDEYEMDLSDENDDPNIISTSTKPKKIRKQKVIAEEKPDISTYDYGIDPDMVPQRPKHKKEKERLKKQNKNNYLAAEENADEALALVRGRKLKEEMIRKVQNGPMPEEEKNAEMEKIKSWNFRSQRLERVIERPGAGSKFLSFLGWAVGALLSLPVSPVMYIASYITSLFGDKAKMQKKREHNMIPGWDGKTFDTEASGKEILADFRRVPTIWSYLTADKAADDEGKKPRDPVITVYADQPKDGSSEAMVGGSIGHTMLGIEYSRFSKISNRYERYGLKYGFYPAGGRFTLPLTLTLQNRNAVIPGQLMNDREHRFSISRRYPAKPKQVNDIIKASETYADKGYGYYDRNCTTFVKEMVVDVAHLATGGEIFKNSGISFTHRENFGLFLGNMTGSVSEI